MTNYKLVALLPIKAHSERIKKKNFRNFNGKPLFHWILNTLLSIKEIDLIVINTDARQELAEYGLPVDTRILVRDRKPELLGDFTNINLILHDDMAAVQSEMYLMTHATNPLLKKETIESALTDFKNEISNHQIDSLFAVNRFQSRFYQEDASAVNHNPKELLRTQDLKPLYEENSNLYIFTHDSFKATGARIGRNPKLFVTPRIDSCDIDDIESWSMAEEIALLRGQK